MKTSAAAGPADGIGELPRVSPDRAGEDQQDVGGGDIPSEGDDHVLAQAGGGAGVVGFHHYFCQPMFSGVVVKKRPLP